MEKNIRPKAQLTRCKKHPKHRQSPGVCSICLGDKLFRLSSQSSSSSSSSRNNNAKVVSVSSSSSLSSLSSHDSSSNASSCSSSPMHPHRQDLEAKGYTSFLKINGKNSVVLTKSRSMEFYDHAMQDREIRVVEHEKKNGGFWSKIFGNSSRSKKMASECLMHSRTMRDQRFSTGVH